MSDSVYTTIATWVMPILSALKPYRDGEDILREVGIDIHCIEDANQRIPVDKMTQLWNLAEEISGDDCIGLEVIKYVSPTSFFMPSPMPIWPVARFVKAWSAWLSFPMW